MNLSKGFYMPAEWEMHERTIMQWPVKSALIWPDNYERVCGGYAQVARSIAGFEKVTMLVNEDTAEEAKRLCGGEVEYIFIPHSDGWFRDNGPTFLVNDKKEIAAVNWQFNAWGEKYPAYVLDNQVTPQLLQYWQIPYFDAPMVLEGGSIHVDGQGTLLTTEQCLLNKNRNRHLTKEQIETELKRYLGVSRIIWLKRGLFGDETDGHIDNVACFGKPGVVLVQTCSDPSDPNYEISRENLQILKNSRDAQGRSLEIIEIPQPPARYFQGVRLTLSYINFYMANGGIILPVFGGEASYTDEVAIGVLKDLFPDRQIVTVDGMAVITEGGNVHCITQQMPQGIRPGYGNGEKNREVRQCEG